MKTSQQFDRETTEQITRATSSLLDKICASIEQVRDAVDAGETSRALNLWRQSSLPRQVRGVSNFIHQAAFLERQQQQYESTSSSTSSSTYSSRTASSGRRITGSDLPNDKDELRQIVQSAAAKLSSVA